MADEVLSARAGSVLTITLNRPDVFNAFNRALHDALRAALVEAADPEVRAVVITGAGRGFCSGQDLKEFSELPGGVGQALEETYHPNIRAIRALEKPVIAADQRCDRGGRPRRLHSPAMCGSLRPKRRSSPGSSGSGWFPTRVARGSSTACSGTRARSSGWCRTDG